MFLFEIFQLNEVLDTSSKAFREWFSDSKVVSPDGKPLPVYHGTARPDRVGTHFKKSRATSGPMAFFTDDPTVASNYANQKNDTSLNDDDYEKRFIITMPQSKRPMNLFQSWWSFPSDKRKEITTKASQLKMDDDENFFLDDSNNNGMGAFIRHLKQERGNTFLALLHEWVYSGTFINQEDEFLNILKMCGVDYPIKYIDPNMKMPSVYQVFLRIINPLDTSNIPQNVIEALKIEAMKRKKPSGFYGDTFHKKNIDPKSWFNDLMADQKNGTDYVWISIPDWVTDTLKRLNYDGIKDKGGKFNDFGHTVWIPFYDWQIKSAISNKTFSYDNKNILK